MSITANFGLLSGAGSQALANFAANQNNINALNGYSHYNEFTEKNHGFNLGSIFSNSAGNSSLYGPANSFQLTGQVPNKVSSMYSAGGFGSSLVGNYYNSISSVVLGQDAPTSVFEQRLAYSMGLRELPKQTYPTGNYSNLFNIDSSSSSKSSSYNVFGESIKGINGASATSKLMSSLSVMG